MQRQFTLVVLLLLIIFSQSFAQLESLQTTTTARLNVRSGPGTDFRVVGVAPNGTPVNLDGRSGEWVRGITADGVVGWMIASAMATTDTAQLRIVSTDTPFNLGAPARPAGEGGGAGLTQGVAATANSRVNVRSGPDTFYRRVDGLDVNSPFTLDGRDSGGRWVRGITAGGNVGWVAARYLNISANLLDLPVVGIDTPFGLSAPVVSAPAAATPVAPVETVVNVAPVRGFSYGGHIANMTPETVNAMRTAGMTWVKRQWRYTDGQPGSDVAGMINEAHANGFRILIGVVGQNPGDINAPGYLDRFGSFVAGVAASGADAIEIWNEPNIDREWPAGQISPAAYTDMLRVSYNAIKGANPNTLVISGAPAPTGFFGGCSGAGCDDNRFVEGMAAAGAANYMDCIGVHYNEGIVPPTATSGDPRNPSDYYTRYLRPMIDVYYNAFRGARQVCFTELGYLTPEGYGPLPSAFGWAANVTVAQQAAWLDGAVNLSARSGRVRLVIVWNVDFSDYGADPVGGYAMIRPGGGCPACEALGS
ncbi:MAG: hypothetical protein OHK0046_31800 [Anaerolineae bacterium]